MSAPRSSAPLEISRWGGGGVPEVRAQFLALRGITEHARAKRPMDLRLIVETHRRSSPDQAAGFRTEEIAPQFKTARESKASQIGERTAEPSRLALRRVGQGDGGSPRPRHCSSPASSRSLRLRGGTSAPLTCWSTCSRSRRATHPSASRETRRIPFAVKSSERWSSTPHHSSAVSRPQSTRR